MVYVKPNSKEKKSKQQNIQNWRGVEHSVNDSIVKFIQPLAFTFLANSRKYTFISIHIYLKYSLNYYYCRYYHYVGKELPHDKNYYKGRV